MGAPEVVDTLSQAQMLNQRLGKPPDPLLLRALAIARLTGNFQEALVFGDQLLQLADQQGDPILLVEGHYVLGVTLSWAGSFTRSRIHLEQALAHYDPTQSSAHITRYSQDPSVICQCRLAFDLWCLGYPEQAGAVQYKGLAQAHALRILQPGLRADLGCDVARRDAQCRFAARLGRSGQCAQRGTPSSVLVVMGNGAAGLGAGRIGRAGAGYLAELQRGAKQMRADVFPAAVRLILLVEQLAKTGQIERGLELVNEAVASTENGRYWCDAELERLRGELLLAKGVAGRHAEAAYRRAIQIAQAAGEDV